MEKGVQIALRYLENKLTRLINRGVLIKLTQSQNNYSNLHFYCSTLVFNIYFFGVCQIIGGARAPPAPPHATALLWHHIIFHQQAILHPPNPLSQKKYPYHLVVCDAPSAKGAHYTAAVHLQIEQGTSSLYITKKVHNLGK